MSARHQMAGLIMTGQRFATLSNLDMQQCPKMFCNFVQKVLAKNKIIPFITDDLRPFLSPFGIAVIVAPAPKITV
jgi:hypothetical protein